MIPQIHNKLNSFNLYLSEEEYINIIFKGGNIMSFFFVDIIKECILKNDIKNKKLNILYDYLVSKNINIDPNYKDLFFKNSEKTIGDFLTEQEQKFKISDVDFTIYININNALKYSLVNEVYGKILMNSLVNIKNFFNTYYENIIGDDQLEIEMLLNNNNLDFISNDDPTNINISRFVEYIRIIKKQNIIDTIQIPPNININNQILIDYINELEYILNILYNGTSNNLKYKDTEYIYYNDICNLRLITCIFEYIELIIIYFNRITYFATNNELSNLTNIIKIGLQEMINIHLNSKKKKILLTQFYSIDSINLFLKNIAKSYNNTNDAAANLYVDKYAVKLNDYYNEEHEIHKLDRKDNNQDLIFHPIVKNTPSNINNEINISSRADTILSCVNNMNLYLINNVKNNENNIHYITYNNAIFIQNSLITKSFDLYRIKFNIIGLNIFNINGNKQEKYKIPSEFIDVSISRFQDISRINFYNEVQQEGIFIYKIIHNESKYFWDSYSLLQLYNDLYDVLFLQTLIISWLDVKYDKRITRVLILYCILKLSEVHKSNEWLINICDILKLMLSIKTFILNRDINNYPFEEISKFIVDTQFVDNPTNIIDICKYLIKNVIVDLKKSAYLNLLHINTKYSDFNILIKFVIFYSYIMYLPNFFDIINTIRENSAINKYELNQTKFYKNQNLNILDYNNEKFSELIDLIISNLSVIIFICNELITNFNFNDLNIINNNLPQGLNICYNSTNYNIIKLNGGFRKKYKIIYK